MEWQVEYYQKENGKIPVLEYLLTLQPKLRAKVFQKLNFLRNTALNCVNHTPKR